MPNRFSSGSPTGPSSGFSAFIDAVPLRLTLAACAWCVVVFLALGLRGGDVTWAEAAPWGHLPPASVWEGKPWVLFTSAFVHIEPMHLLFNLYWLWILGNILEQKIGSLRFAVFFAIAAWISSSLQLLLEGNAGIGMSGVNYALFGFGWVARRKMPEFAAILNQQTVAIFVLWLVGCAIATHLGLANIANGAHLGGLLVGVAAASVFLNEKRWLGALGLAALAALSFVTLRWCPASPDWNGLQAMRAHDARRYDEALAWYQKALDRGADASWAWSNIALVHLGRGDAPGYKSALARLRAVDSKAAQEIEGEYGTGAAQAK